MTISIAATAAATVEIRVSDRRMYPGTAAAAMSMSSSPKTLFTARAALVRFARIDN